MSSKDRLLITIDGTSASGKSTVAKLVAGKLKFINLDTGAIYRAIAYHCAKSMPDLLKPEQNQEQLNLDVILQTFSYTISDDGKRQFLNNEDITEALRTPEISNLASKLAIMPEVRALSNKIQRDLAKGRNVVVEGRDSGSVVFTDADVKFFIDASTEERAKRRLSELKGKYKKRRLSMSIDSVIKDIENRDRRDSNRQLSPLRRAKDSIYIDSTDIGASAATKKILKEVKTHRKQKKPYKFGFFAKRNLNHVSWVYKVIYFTAHLFFKVFYRLSLYGKENFIDGPAIVIANHESFLDPPLVGSSVPGEMHSMASEYLFKNRVMKWALPKIGCHPVSRTKNSPGVMKMMENLLARGKKILIFPEGSRSEDGKIKPFKKGIGLLALMSKCPIIPIFIEGTHEAWPKRKKFPKLMRKLSVTIGTPLLWEDYERRSATAKEAAKKITEDSEKTLTEMQKNHTI